MRSIAAAALLGLVALGATTGQGQARGCLSGAAVGGVAGHVAGHHGVLGAAAGCAIGHHQASKHDQQAARRATPDNNSGDRGNSESAR